MIPFIFYTLTLFKNDLNICASTVAAIELKAKRPHEQSELLSTRFLNNFFKYLAFGLEKLKNFNYYFVKLLLKVLLMMQYDE